MNISDETLTRGLQRCNDKIAAISMLLDDELRLQAALHQELQVRMKDWFLHKDDSSIRNESLHQSSVVNDS